MTSPSIDELEVEYARFNARKTFSTMTPSAFEHTHAGGLVATRDAQRTDAYYNRILGLTPGSVTQLDSAIAWIEQGTAPDANIRIDISCDSDALDGHIVADLTSRGFHHSDTLVWLDLDQSHDDQPASGPAVHDAAVATNMVRELTTQDWPSIRRNRNHEWPIEDLIWQHKRQYLCTDTFRWFGIFADQELVSTASTWTATTPNVTILGSAFTLPQYRNRGLQRQLLEARCRLVPGPLFVDVSPDSSSYRNCVRSGFSDLDHRQVWTRNEPADVGAG